MPDAILHIRVIPRARRSCIEGVRGGAWLVRLQSPPVGGAANDELLGLLARTFGVARRAISIVSGEGSRHKRVRVAGIEAAAAEAILQRIRE